MKFIIDQQSPLSKYYQLAIILEKMIKSRKFPVGSILPSERDLITRYRVSRATVRQALMKLENKGLIVKEQGKGTRVISAVKSFQPQDTVAICISCRGHLYERFSRRILDLIQDCGCHALVMNIMDAEGRCDSKRRMQRHLDRLLSYRPKTFIIQGLSVFPFQWLKEKHVNNVIFTLHYETLCSFPRSPKVLIDYEHGAYAGMRHLLDLGHRNIVVLTYPPQKERFYYIHDFFRGCNRAYREKGLRAGAYELAMMKENEKQSRDMLTALFSRSRRPTAVFSFSDSQAKFVYQAARASGLRIPEDLAIVGFYNTPWCDVLYPKLTSISIHEEDVAQRTVQAMIDPSRSRKTQWVKPSLIVRESTGSTLQNPGLLAP